MSARFERSDVGLEILFFYNFYISRNKASFRRWSIENNRSHSRSIHSSLCFNTYPAWRCFHLNQM